MDRFCTLATTNPMASTIDIVKAHARNVKPWRAGDAAGGVSVGGSGAGPDPVRPAIRLVVVLVALEVVVDAVPGDPVADRQVTEDVLADAEGIDAGDVGVNERVAQLLRQLLDR